MPVVVKAPRRKTAHVEPEEDSFAEGIINVSRASTSKKGRVGYFIDPEELADYLRNL